MKKRERKLYSILYQRPHLPACPWLDLPYSTRLYPPYLLTYYLPQTRSDRQTLSQLYPPSEKGTRIHCARVLGLGPLPTLPYQLVSYLPVVSYLPTSTLRHILPRAPLPFPLLRFLFSFLPCPFPSLPSLAPLPAPSCPVLSAIEYSKFPQTPQLSSALPCRPNPPQPTSPPPRSAGCTLSSSGALSPPVSCRSSSGGGVDLRRFGRFLVYLMGSRAGGGGGGLYEFL